MLSELGGLLLASGEELLESRYTSKELLLCYGPLSQELHSFNSHLKLFGLLGCSWFCPDTRSDFAFAVLAG